MAEKSLQARIQNKCDTTANWAKATNFVPKKGEIIVYSDGGGTGVPKMKVGDGTTKVGSLKFITATVPDASDTVNGIVNTGEQTFGGNKTFQKTLRVVDSNGNSPSIALGRADSSSSYLFLYPNSLNFGTLNNSGGSSTGASLKFSLHTIECYGSFVSYNSSSLGKADKPWPKAYITNLIGNADTATSASTVNGHTVNSDVPADAKFTDTVYSLPIASSSTLGGVKIGSGLTVAEDGTISAAAEYTLPTASSTTKGGIKVGSGLTMSSETLNHSNNITAKTAYGSTSTTASANGGSITVTDIKYDAQGHITGSTDRTITLSQTTYTLAGLMGSTAKGSATQPVYWNGSAWTNTTYTLGKSVPTDAKFTDTVYSLPAATATTLGGIIAGEGLSITTDGKLSVSKVPHALSINGKSFDGSAAIDVGVIGAAYGGSGETSLSASANAYLNSLPYNSAPEDTLTDNHIFFTNDPTGQTNCSAPMSKVYTYMKGKLDSVYQPVGSYLTAIPKATTSVLGGIKLGTGLTAAADGTVNVSVGGATITLKTWTDADVA